MLMLASMPARADPISATIITAATGLTAATGGAAFTIATPVVGRGAVYRFSSRSDRK
jgi:hypothetical protein